MGIKDTASNVWNSGGQRAFRAYQSGGLSELDNAATGGAVSRGLTDASQAIMDPHKASGTAIPGVSDVQQIQAPGQPAGQVAGRVANTTGFAGGHIAGVAGPQAATISETANGGAAFRNAQLGLLGQLQGQAAGTAPSVSQAQYNQARQNAQAALFSQLASQRGAANPLAARTAAMMNAQQQAQLGGQAGIARLQEQQGAQNALANFSGTARQQDIGTALANQNAINQAGMEGYRGQLQSALAQGQLDQRTGEAQYQGRLQGDLENARLGGQFQDLQARYAQMGMNAQQANQMAALQVNQMRNQGAIAQTNANKQMAGSMFGSAAGILGTVGGAYVGGPAGAAAGSAVGNAVGQGVDNYNGSNATTEDVDAIDQEMSGAPAAPKARRGGV